ncbi:hypothetical protein [Nocardia arthritidis]|uniref:Uncharacterized protein n=1 Tax=Nocardia arthritidis TaxID=228602 RepID=A0A6G9YGF4_9NOCA|nr:hypothetical protein [Nocardia arthritidis]QIS12220.1 hypothetical protein F5544_21790 [Nocardia arthritidis]
MSEWDTWKEALKTLATQQGYSLEVRTSSEPYCWHLLDHDRAEIASGSLKDLEGYLNAIGRRQDSDGPCGDVR